MSYKLIYTKIAFKDIQKLDTVTKKRLKAKLENYSKDPFKYSKKLVHSSIGSYRWRIGNYRVVFDVSGNNIIILRIGHRREIYK